MNRPDRRIFLLHGGLAAVCTLAWLPIAASAQAPTVQESDPQALALGYKTDTAAVDAKKYPAHTAAQHCGNCQLFQGKPTEVSGACPLFGGRHVATKGWCSAWVKKTG